MAEQISLMLKKFKLSQQRVTIQSDDGTYLNGIIESLDNWTVKVQIQDGVMFVPIQEITAVKPLEEEFESAFREVKHSIELEGGHISDAAKSLIKGRLYGEISEGEFNKRVLELIADEQDL